MAHKTKRSARSARSAARVHTGPAPLVIRGNGRSLAPHVNAARALRILRHLAPLAGQHAGADWWQGALDVQDDMADKLARLDAARSATIAAERAKVDAHNQRLVEAASLVSLGVKDVAETGILSIDPAEILAEARRRKNKGKRGHKSANRWLAYACPICTVEKERPNGTIERSNTVRCSADNRLIVCCGTNDKPHDQAIMYLIEESQPKYRLDDKYQVEDAGQEAGVLPGHTQTRSQEALAFNRAKRVANAPDALAATLDALAPPRKDETIPF